MSSARVGKPDPNGRWCTVDDHGGPTMGLGNRRHDREPEANTLTASSAITARKALEGAIRQLRSKARTVVGHVDLDALSRSPGGEHDLAFTMA